MPSGRKRISHLNKSLIVFYVLVVYITASFLWWTYLLVSQNSFTFEQSRQLYFIEMAGEGIDRQEAMQTDDYRELENRYRRQNIMIAGEGTVFFLLLGLGIWRIRKSFLQEIGLASRQRNFLLSVTHELKSPIASIKLVLETLSKRELEPVRKQKILQNSISDINRLQFLVEDILLAAKFEDKEFEFAREPVNFSKVVQEATEKLMDIYEEKRDFNRHIESGVMVKGDSRVFYALVSNVLENAIKYSPLGSTIELTLSQTNKNVVLEIADQGIGIPDEEKGNVFKKFYRIGNEEIRRTKGTGLGLFIVKEIVDRHKGQVIIKNNEPKGTRFIIVLPKLKSGKNE